jgi:NhaP-type Na+/H+ or K+/H+ antiporter
VAQKVITFDRGSKRRLKQIRWKIGEIASLAFLVILVAATIIVVLLWELNRTHPYSEPPPHPQFKDARPTDP